MTNLINVTSRGNQLLVSSREVAENFGKRHDHILRDLDYIKNGVTQNWGDLFYETTYIHEQNKQEYREVLMNRDGFTLLAMGFTGKKALEWKLKYIEAFNKMEQTLSQPVQIDSKFIFQIAQQLEEKEKQIALDRPKVIFAEALETSNNSILVGELAKLLARNGIGDMGQNRLFGWLRKNNFLHKNGEQYNLPTQKSIELEVIETKVTTINNPDGSVRVTKTPKITGKGQIYFVNKFKNNELISC